jgi:hypothetical protein
VKAESGGSVEEPGKEPESVQQTARTCPVCGTKFFATGSSGRRKGARSSAEIACDSWPHRDIN